MSDRGVTLRPRNGRRSERFVAGERQLDGAGVPLVRFFSHARCDDRGELLRHARTHHQWLWRRNCEMRGDLAFQGVARERTLAGQALIQHTRRTADSTHDLTAERAIPRHQPRQRFRSKRIRYKVPHIDDLVNSSRHQRTACPRHLPVGTGGSVAGWGLVAQRWVAPVVVAMVTRVLVVIPVSREHR
jgi:hypothetical protein